MRVIGTVGLAGSGKGEFAEVAREAGVPIVTMGDVIRAECRDRGLDPADHHGEVARALREENGPGAIAERSLPLIREALEESDVVLVDGLRSDVEVDAFEDAFGDAFSLVSVEAPYAVREERITDRGRDNTEHETLAERDARELGFGMGRAMDRADLVVENVDSLERLRERAHTVVEEGIDAVEPDDGFDWRESPGAEELEEVGES
ncbi:AAA family ATPase [Haloglomus salinum]|jgi:dephospho-CoA kinase|uniref:AAA family ATPase n=1 Tax=Haloglomus salinum TaxID=2962673 RepID=UPI0020C9C56F|nr:AAA family ATPase [Haloglomus salinum]